MTMRSRFRRPKPVGHAMRGVLSLDALFSMVPVLAMLLLVMEIEAASVKQSEEASHRQQVFDRLVSAADYTVKSGAAVRDGGTRYPNWIDERNITATYTNSLRERIGLGSLYVGLGWPGEDYSMCIYRLVVVGEGKAIRRLFVCGG